MHERRDRYGDELEEIGEIVSTNYKAYFREEGFHEGKDKALINAGVLEHLKNTVTCQGGRQVKIKE